jgi:hypothetical protein
MDKGKWLKYYLLVFGLLNIFVISFTVPLLFGDWLLWTPRNIPDEMMISGLYFCMGLVMILAAKKPLSHKSFVDFLVIANICHAVVMIIYARNALHLLVDVPSVGLIGVLPLFFYPWGLKNFLRY